MVPHEQNVIALEQRKNENDSHNPEVVGSNPAPATINTSPDPVQRSGDFLTTITITKNTYSYVEYDSKNGMVLWFCSGWLNRS